MALVKRPPNQPGLSASALPQGIAKYTNMHPTTVNTHTTLSQSTASAVYSVGLSEARLLSASNAHPLQLNLAGIGQAPRLKRLKPSTNLHTDTATNAQLL